MKNIAIIPARGGSKRIPRKNIKPFMGKPIIAYSIEAALESGLFDEVMVMQRLRMSCWKCWNVIKNSVSNTIPCAVYIPQLRSLLQAF